MVESSSITWCFLVVLNDVHLRRLIRCYISYYNADRIHETL